MCAWVRCCGGSSKKYISNNIGSLAISSPTPTTSNPTNRVFTKNSGVKGLASSNYYRASDCTMTTIEPNKVKVVGVNNASYGYGYVLPDIVKGGDNLRLDITRNTDVGCGVGVNFYKSDGTFIGYSRFMLNGDGVTNLNDVVPVPNDAEYAVLLFIPSTTSSSGYTFTLNAISVE